jgi:hypothetical protein
MFGWFSKSKKTTKENRVDKRAATERICVQTADQIIAAWDKRDGEFDFLAHHGVVSAIAALIEALRIHHPGRLFRRYPTGADAPAGCRA